MGRGSGCVKLLGYLKIENQVLFCDGICGQISVLSSRLKRQTYLKVGCLAPVFGVYKGVGVVL